MTWRVVNTDNLGGDWPNEKFVGESHDTKEAAEAAAEEWNEKYSGDYAPRYAIVVEEPYELKPGFEP